MLRQAARTCSHGNVCLLRQDIRRLRLPHPVELVSANFDTLNHLVAASDLRLAFRRIHDNLRPGGHLYFDLITPCQPLGGRRAYVRRFGAASRQMFQRIHWSPRRRLLSIIVVFHAPNALRSTLEVHWERAYSLREVGRWLLEAGFVIRGIHDAATLRVARGCPPRIIVVAQKHSRVDRPGPYLHGEVGGWYIREESDKDSDGERQRRLFSCPASRARPMAMLGEPAPTTARPIEIIGGFAFDRTKVVPAEHAKLIRVARLILRGARGPIRLVGHTDPVGTQAYNLALGRRRALEVQHQLVSTLERIRRGSSRPVRFTIESAGETRPVSTGTIEAERARNRRVEIVLPLIAPPPFACRYDIKNAFEVEREAARRTLTLSAQAANRFIQTVGAVSARGRFIPTVTDNKHWFAKLYEFTTYYEIAEASRFRHPAFVLHFIPIFYDLYYRALENWTTGNRASVSSLWTTHFTRAGRPDNRSIRAWMGGVLNSIVTGTTAHVQGDMATAFERGYRSYVAKYCLSSPPRFDEFRPDFFGRNLIIFERSKAAFLLHLSQFSPFPVGPEWGQFLFAKGEPLVGGLDIGEVNRWREAAWSEARRRLGQ
jgi:outer membrane protein OmpA-like peptidoglycan-associated protein